mmetsp:Transcript_21269/g.43603  ORF Transcript_21269/g.43603 Transcript_21269/m.43603 type:complete len:224 (+) Transcript_21269:594-1265(+)
MISCRRASVSKSTDKICPAPAGAKRHENLLGVAIDTSCTAFSPMACLTISLTLYSLSAMIPGAPSMKRALYRNALPGPISFLADANVEFPPKSGMPHGASTDVVSEYTSHLPSNQVGYTISGTSSPYGGGDRTFSVTRASRRPLSSSDALSFIGLPVGNGAVGSAALAFEEGTSSGPHKQVAAPKEVVVTWRMKDRRLLHDSSIFNALAAGTNRQEKTITTDN